MHEVKVKTLVDIRYIHQDAEEGGLLVDERLMWEKYVSSVMSTQ